jgi:hypothetical protein
VGDFLKPKMQKYQMESASFDHAKLDVQQVGGVNPSPFYYAQAVFCRSRKKARMVNPIIRLAAPISGRVRFSNVLADPGGIGSNTCSTVGVGLGVIDAVLTTVGWGDGGVCDITTGAITGGVLVESMGSGVTRLAGRISSNWPA